MLMFNYCYLSEQSNSESKSILVLLSNYSKILSCMVTDISLRLGRITLGRITLGRVTLGRVSTFRLGRVTLGRVTLLRVALLRLGRVGRHLIGRGRSLLEISPSSWVGTLLSTLLLGACCDNTSGRSSRLYSCNSCVPG